ncbi:MAG: FadR/GntR family transcriptional regulator [Bacillota bacterium]
MGELGGGGDTLKSDLVKRIKDHIIGGNLKPGDRLPTERKMSEQYGVSRTVIRDAVKTLSGLGLLEVRHRVGTFVADVDSQAIARQLSSLVIYNRHTVKSLYQVRMVLEAAMAGWAAECRSEEGLQKLRSLIEETRACIEGPSSYVCFREIDRRFHLAMAEVSQNPIVFELMSSLLTYLEAYSRFTLLIPGRVRSSAAEHEIIFEAVLNGDPETARGAMYQHIHSVFSSVNDSWDVFDPRILSGDKGE